MIRSIIIDDEQNCVSVLSNDLQKHCPSIEVVAACFSAKEGMMAIKKINPDLIFLDVEMPWMNGFEMLEILGDIGFSIIFTTAHDEFAAKAFRISAVDYLLKPIDAEDLKAAVQKVQDKMQGQSNGQRINNLLRNIREPSVNQKVALPNREGYEFVEVSSVLYCQAEGAYTKIFLDGKKMILVSKSLGDVEELLPPELFQRIHHSTVINLSCVSQFVRSDGGYVILKDGEKFSVSKTKREMLMTRLGLK